MVLQILRLSIGVSCLLELSEFSLFTFIDTNGKGLQVVHLVLKLLLLLIILLVQFFHLVLKGIHKLVDVRLFFERRN